MKQNVSIQYSSNDFLILEDRAIYFAKNNDCIDCMEIAKIADIENIYISWFGILLQGSSEIESNPLFFGELDKEGVFIESKPVYHLQASDELEYTSANNNRESNNSLSTLDVFLNGSRLTLLNYSLLDSSLNITLECNSSESKAILEKEKAQREQRDKDSQTQEFKDKDSKNKDSLPLASNDRESQTQDSSLTASNDKSQSSALLHPILEDNEIKCPHNGVVKLKNNKGKTFTSKGIPLASKDISFISKRHFIYF